MTGLEWSRVDVERRLAWLHSDRAKVREAIGIPLKAEVILVFRRQAEKDPQLVFMHRGRNAHLAPDQLAEFAERLSRPRAIEGTRLAHDKGGKEVEER